MLSEFYCIFIFLVPVIVFVMSFSKTIDSRLNNENKVHTAIHSFFMNNDCTAGAKCSSSQIDVKDVYVLKVRQPSKALSYANKGGQKNESLDVFYKELEEKIKANTGK